MSTTVYKFSFDFNDCCMAVPRERSTIAYSATQLNNRKVFCKRLKVNNRKVFYRKKNVMNLMQVQTHAAKSACFDIGVL
jgi:hypothetical protein